MAHSLNIRHHLLEGRLMRIFLKLTAASCSMETVAANGGYKILEFLIGFKNIGQVLDTSKEKPCSQYREAEVGV